MFGDYVKLGFEHILDPQGYDHILFVVALAIVYNIRDWKKVAILVTAFTLGHSLTLALSALDLVSINADLIEMLIPVTIMLTAIFNIWSSNKSSTSSIQANYGLAAGFGLIHGLGFSNFFKAIIGKEEIIVQPLLAFNLGVELGQLIIVLLVLCISFLLSRLIEHKMIKIVVSSIILVWATYLLLS
jgi:hypothetical protein